MVCSATNHYELLTELRKVESVNKDYEKRVYLSHCMESRTYIAFHDKAYVNIRLMIPRFSSHPVVIFPLLVCWNVIIIYILPYFVVIACLSLTCVCNFHVLYRFSSAKAYINKCCTTYMYIFELLCRAYRVTVT